MAYSEGSHGGSCALPSTDKYDVICREESETSLHNSSGSIEDMPVLNIVELDKSPAEEPSHTKTKLFSVPPQLRYPEVTDMPVLNFVEVDTNSAGEPIQTITEFPRVPLQRHGPEVTDMPVLSTVELDKNLAAEPSHTRTEFFTVPPQLHGAELPGPAKGKRVFSSLSPHIEVNAMKYLHQDLKMRGGSTRGIRAAKTQGELLLRVQHYLETLQDISKISPGEDKNWCSVDRSKFDWYFEKLIEDLELESSGYNILGKRAFMYIPFLLQLAEDLLNQENNLEPDGTRGLIEGQTEVAGEELAVIYPDAFGADFQEGPKLVIFDSLL